MPDYSLISDSDLISLKKGDYSSISTEGLLELKRQSAPPTPTIGEMRRREEQPGFGQPIPQSEEPDQGPPQVGQPFPLANRPQSPVGSLEQLNLAVEQSGNIGRIGRTNFNFSQNEGRVDYNDPKFENKDLLKESLILGPQSAAKLQDRRERQSGSLPPAAPGQYSFPRPIPESDLSPEEAAYLSKERSERASQYAGTAVRYGGPAAATLMPGGMAPLAAAGVIGGASMLSEAGAEKLQDGELNYGNILAAGVNIPPYGLAGFLPTKVKSSCSNLSFLFSAASISLLNLIDSATSALDRSDRCFLRSAIVASTSKISVDFLPSNFLASLIKVAISGFFFNLLSILSCKAL